ncbi:molybdopterin molybdotransferase MoeA [bacterium]|nr:molybdopterin molybdotransferase MoeA [bacterium]
MKTIPDSLSPLEAWQRLARISPLETEVQGVKHANGFVLAQDLRVPEDVPPAHRAFMDGYAVRAQDTEFAPVNLELAGEIAMGQASRDSIQTSQAIRIPTGGFLPHGADAVVMQENTEATSGQVRILKSVKIWENVQACGEDFRKGDILLPDGHTLRPQDLSAIATFGISELKVYRKPTIRIFSTGNELVPFTENKPSDGMIRETNSLSLANAAAKFGFDARISGIFPDEFEVQRNALEEAMRSADVVLISGGSSVGDRDYTLPVIQSFSGHQIFFHGLAIRPGNPTIFATIGSHSIFGLPGQPVSSLIVFYQFVLPLLYHLAGETVDYPAFHDSRFVTRTVHLAESVRPLKAKTDYARLRIFRRHEEWLASPIVGKSASLSTLVHADGFTVIPPGEKELSAGSLLKAYLFP